MDPTWKVQVCRQVLGSIRDGPDLKGPGVPTGAGKYPRWTRPERSRCADRCWEVFALDPTWRIWALAGAKKYTPSDTTLKVSVYRQESVACSFQALFGKSPCACSRQRVGTLRHDPQGHRLLASLRVQARVGRFVRVNGGVVTQCRWLGLMGHRPPPPTVDVTGEPPFVWRHKSHQCAGAHRLSCYWSDTVALFAKIRTVWIFWRRRRLIFVTMTCGTCGSMDSPEATGDSVGGCLIFSNGCRWKAHLGSHFQSQPRKKVLEAGGWGNVWCILCRNRFRAQKLLPCRNRFLAHGLGLWR